MRKIFLLSMVMLLSLPYAQAQFKAAKKKATKAAGMVATSLDDAKKMMDEAITEAESASDAKPGAISKIYASKGKMYSGLVAADADAIALKAIKGDAEIRNGDAGPVAYAAYTKALETAVKKGDAKVAVSGLISLATDLNVVGREKYGLKEYKGAFSDFNTILEIKNTLEASGNKSILDKKEDYENTLFIAGVSAYIGQMLPKAEGVFEKLYAAEYDNALVYEALFKINAESDETKAFKYLEDGIKKYPDDKNLRIAEINYYIQKGRFGELEGKLKEAIKREPENSSLDLTLANIYDQIYQKDLEKNGVKLDANNKVINDKFAESITYYQATLDKIDKAGKGDKFVPTYAQGALLFNAAAKLSQALSEIPFSNANLKKMDKMEADIKSIFDEALPYFLEAYKLNSKDRNTLIALKEIYARKGDFDTSNKYKKELEAL